MYSLMQRSGSSSRQLSHATTRWSITPVAAVLCALAACGGGGDTPTPPPVDTFPTPGAGESNVLFTYRLPGTMSGMTASSLTPFAGTQPIQLTANGAGRTNLPTSTPILMGLAPVGGSTPVLLGLNIGASSGQDLTSRSTAEALGFLVPALVTSNSSQASTILGALRASPATAQLTTILDTRFAGASATQVLATADPQVLTTLGTMVTDVLRTTTSPRYDEPLRALPTSDTPTDRGGIQLTTLPTRDAQGRLQVSLDNGRPRWVSVVRSYSDDGTTWTTPTAENGTFGTMLGPGTRAGQSIQPPTATIPLSPAPFVRVKTFAIGSDLPTAVADPDSRYMYGAVAAQGIASIAVPALEPVLGTAALRTGLTWGSTDQGTLQTWVTAMMPCFQDPTIQAAIQAGVSAHNMDQAFQLVYACAMRAGGNNAAVLSGLLSAAGLGGKTAPSALTGMFNVLSNLGTGVEGIFNTTAIRATSALNTFNVVDSTRFMSIASVTPINGSNSGGTTITISGTNFPASPVPTVTVGDVVATSVTRVSASQLTAVTGAHAASGLVDVKVSAAGYRSATCANCYTYGALPITVTSVTSPFGDVAGGARVAINGTNFVAVNSVTFGGRAATNVQVVSATRIDVTVPAGAAIGSVNVIVTPASGNAVTCTNCFVYFTPTIIVAPTSGSLNGGTPVTVSDIPATSLITAIELGSTPATGLTVISPTSIRFTTPAGALGAVDLNFRYGTLGVLGCPGCYTYINVTNNGRFTGLVRNAITNNPIAGASVSIRTAGTSTQVDVVTTAADGSYRSNPLPAGSYDLHHSAAGYNNSPLFSRTLVGGADTPETSLPVVMMVPTGTSNGNLTGVIRDATNNSVIAGASIEIRNGGSNTSGTALSTTTSAADGSYAFNSLPAGTYTVRATKATYAEGSVNATVSAATQVAPVLFLSPTGSTAFAWRVVLSWGANPRDLDSHLTGPQTGTTSRFHIYYGNKGSLTANPFSQLDIDFTQGNGPETVTIAQQIAGVYRYYVYKYAGTGDIKSSGARVDLYQGNTLVRQFYPPQQTGDYWTVFELSGAAITTVNVINGTEPSIAMPSRGPLRVRDARPGDELRNLAPFPAKGSGGGGPL